jgi:hypothetical protein
MFRILGHGLVIGFFAICGLIQAQSPCTKADLKGDFATQPIGFLTTGPYAGPFAGTGLIRFDGEGRFQGVATSSFNGTIVFPFNAIGNFTVSPDCFVTIFDQVLQIAFEGYFSRNKERLFFFQPQEFTVTTNILHRLHISSCTDESLRGRWVIQASGGSIITGGRLAQIGALHFDGVGGVRGQLGSSVNGAIIRNILIGTYRVTSDCSFSVRLSDENGIVFHTYGTLFGEGSQFVFIYSDKGAVITGVAEQIVNE